MYPCVSDALMYIMYVCMYGLCFSALFLGYCWYLTAEHLHDKYQRKKPGQFDDEENNQ